MSIYSVHKTFAQAPCKDCQERHTACHDTCDKYKTYKEDFNKKKKDYESKVCSEIDKYTHSRHAKNSI